jgi:hypothetical protein
MAVEAATPKLRVRMQAKVAAGVRNKLRGEAIITRSIAGESP